MALSFVLFIIVSNLLVFDIWASSDMEETNGTISKDNNATGADFEYADVYYVAGGVPAYEDEFPFMVAIGCKQLSGEIEYHCGGALIAPNFVLTAAHCTSNKGQVPDYVRVGGAPLNDEEPENQPLEVFKVHVHPLYKRKQFYHDIALLELKIDHSPACLWINHTIEVENVTAIGYGQEVFAGPNTNDLLKASLAIVPNEKCTSFYPPYIKLRQGIVDTQVCAGDFSGVRDTCQGDSGGPIVANIGEWPYDLPYVLGVTSFGQGCASGSPSIYIRVSKYIDWIEEITNLNFTTCILEQLI